MELPHISNANPKKIHEFYEKLMYCVQALQTMNKLQQVEGNVAMTLDKLLAIRGDLVRTDSEWESWGFDKLEEALRQWTRRNAIDNKATEREQEQENKRRDRFNKVYHARQDYKQKGCVYCDDVNQKAVGCTEVKSVSDRKQILAKRRLCFNCTGGSHRTAECPSKKQVFKLRETTPDVHMRSSPRRRTQDAYDGKRKW